MATFIVVPLPSGNENMNTFIREKFGNECYMLENGNWLVSYNGTSKQLSDELLISNGHYGSAIILNFTGYWGHATADIWEWISGHSKQ